MKRKHLTMSIVIALSTVNLLAAILVTGDSGRSADVILRVTPDKNRILLGEPLNLGFEFFNEGPNDVRIPKGGVMTGNIEIFVSRKGEGFRKYFRSDWGRKSEQVMTLAMNEKYEVENAMATVLWNGKPDYSHLNPEAAKRIKEKDNRLLTDYAFPSAGTYLVKATSCLMTESNECSIPIESVPVEIEVSEPVGEDLEVWNQIRGNREIAMLIQKGLFTSDKDVDKKQNILVVEQIIQRFPNSVYSSYLKTNLEKSRVTETKRNEFYKRLKPPPNPE